MATNDFLPFSVGGGANVITQSAYAALSSLLSNGFQTGTALSNQLNKVWRQSSIMSAVVGNLINGITNQNTIDDGTTATLSSNLHASIMRSGYVDDAGATNAYSLTLSPAPLAYYDGMRVSFSTVNASTLKNPTLNVNALGATTITGPNGISLTPGAIQSNTICELTYNTTGPRFELTAGDQKRNQYNGMYSIGSTQAIPPGYAGSLINVTALGVTLTLPASNTLPPGTTFEFLSGYNSCVVQRGSVSDVITPDGSTTFFSSIVLNKGDTAQLINDGVGGWYWSNGSKQLKYSLAFGMLGASSGYQILPSGLMMQWGLNVVAGNSSALISYPVSFTSVVYQCYAASVAGTTGTISSPSAVSTNLSQLTLWNGAINPAMSIAWLAIGV